MPSRHAGGFHRLYDRKKDTVIYDPMATEKDRMTMSNKMTIKRTAEPVKKEKAKEKKKLPGFLKRRMDPMSLIPVIVFIGLAIWYFVSSTQ
jgi:hypothetical protein